MSAPDEPASRSSLPIEKPTGAASWLRSVTVTQSPATTCMTRGSGSLRRCLIAAASTVGTYAVREPLVTLDRSIAVRSNGRAAAPAGQGLPGGASGGRPPVVAGCTYDPLGVSTFGRAWRPVTSPGSTRTIPQAP